MALMQRVSPQVELDINDMASQTPSHRPQPKIMTGSLNLHLQLTHMIPKFLHTWE